MVFSYLFFQKWPKIKSRLKVIASSELWKGHMKQIEGHFGTAVVSYFVFLRFLFLMNMVIFSVWFSFVVIPGVIHVIVNDPARAESLAACAYATSQFPASLCPVDDPEIDINSEPIFYQLQVSGEYECNTNDTFTVRGCDFREENLNSSTTIMVAERESSTILQVSAKPPTSVRYVHSPMCA